MGTLRTDLRFAGAVFFFDLDGADFIGADVFVVFLPVVVLLFDERLLVVFLVDPALLALPLDRLEAFLVAVFRVLADLVERAFVVFAGVDARA